MRWCPLLWLRIHINDEKFSAVSAMEHSDQQVQLYAMTNISCFTILTDFLYGSSTDDTHQK